MKSPEPSTSANERLAYSVEEAAEMYGVSRGFVWQRIRNGGLPVKRVGRRVLILRRDLTAFFEKDSA